MLLSQFNHSGLEGALAYQQSTDTLWLVNRADDTSVEQYSKSGVLLQTVHFTNFAGNNWGAEFLMVPEPSTYAPAAIGVIGLLAFRRRTR